MAKTVSPAALLLASVTAAVLSAGCESGGAGPTVSAGSTSSSPGVSAAVPAGPPTRPDRARARSIKRVTLVKSLVK